MRAEAKCLTAYIGPSITMLRARMLGSVVQTLLTVEDVATLIYART